MVRTSLCLRVLRPEDESKDKVLRVRLEASVQKVLGQIPTGAQEADASHVRLESEEGAAVNE